MFYERQFPSRSRARWYDGEVAEVADAFKAGRPITEIAHAHNRSTYAIEHQLDRLGLISTADRYGSEQGTGHEPPAGHQHSGSMRYPDDLGLATAQSRS